MNKPTVFVTVFMDYICPFCYVGWMRLKQLQDDYMLRIYWRFVEIHPQIPPAGQALDALIDDAALLRRKQDSLAELAEQEGLTIAPRTTVSNSQRALKLAEAAKSAGRELFYQLHDRLFRGYFREGLDIGDPGVLHLLAAQAGLPPALVRDAWVDAKYAGRLTENATTARQRGIVHVPTFVIGSRRLTGAVSQAELAQAIRDLGAAPAGS